MSGCPASVAAINRVKGVPKLATLVANLGCRLWMAGGTFQPSGKKCPLSTLFSLHGVGSGVHASSLCAGFLSILFPQLPDGLTGSRYGHDPSRQGAPDGTWCRDIRLRRPRLVGLEFSHTPRRSRCNSAELHGVNWRTPPAPAVSCRSAAPTKSTPGLR